MAVQRYPSSNELIFMFIHDLRRYNANIITGTNPALINMDGTQMYIYIKNLSPAQLSNDNPDIWRIQLPKRKEFEEIKQSDKLFILLGYDYVRKVYTTWNPYWCKQRLNVAESCSMYSRLSLQSRVSNTQKIEQYKLQNEGDVVCVPSILLGSYLMNIKSYYPQESAYTPIGSSIEKRKKEEKQILEESFVKNPSQVIFEQFINCYDTDHFRDFLERGGYKRNTITNYINRLIFVFEQGLIQKYKDLFLNYSHLYEYKHAINKLCWQPEIRPYEILWHKAIHASLMKYLQYVKERLNNDADISEFHEKKNALGKQELPRKESVAIVKNTSLKTPEYTLDDYGKLTSLDSTIIEQLLPYVKDVDYPDWSDVIKQIKKYYPARATESMNPLDWMKLFDSTKWRRKRGRKSANEVSHTQSAYNSDSEIKTDVTENGFSNIAEETDIHDESVIPIEKKDSIDVTTLRMIFDKKVTSYKYFWFMSIISLAKENQTLSFSFREIVIRMAAMAWPIVKEYGIDLGQQDMLKKYLTEIERKEGLNKKTPYIVVESRLRQYYFSQGFDKILSPLLANVPYRFLSPWITFTTKEEVTRKSISSQYQGLYSLIKDGVLLKKEWWTYINSHYKEVYDLTNKSFLSYVKQFNDDIVLLPFMTNGWSFFKKEQLYDNIEPYSTGDIYSTKAAESKDVSDSLEIEHVYLDNKGNVIRTEIEREKAKSLEEESKDAAETIEEEAESDLDSSVKIGTRVRLFPSQIEGVVVNHLVSKSGERRIVIEKDDGSRISAQDHPYLYKIVKKRRKRISEIEKETERKHVGLLLENESTRGNVIKEQFRSFLARRKPISTANRYTEALDYAVREWVKKEVDSTADSVFSYTTSEDVRLCIDMLKSSPGFVRDNVQKHRNMSAALNQYLLFIEEREKGNMN